MNLKLMKKICSLSINKLGKFLIKYLYSKGYKNVKVNNNFIIAEGDIPVCLIAHLDTVFRRLPINFDEYIYDNSKKILWYPGGAGFDDRAGVYSIIQILKDCKPHIIFTNGEENGGIGSQELINKYEKCPFNECKMLIQLDRANEKDMVFYNCDNYNFIKYIEKFDFVEDFGSFSDISIIAPAWGIAAVNLSVGYLDEHSGLERLNCQWCDNTIQKVKNILSSCDNAPSFEYIPFKYIFEPEQLKLSCCVCGSTENLIKADEMFLTYVCKDCYKKFF